MAGISRQDAIRQIRDMQARDVRPESIRQNMMAFGFSFAEIDEMMGSGEKPKRGSGNASLSFDNYGKGKNDFHYETFERGGCLSFYLGFQMIAIVLITLFVCSTFADVSAQTNGSGGFLLGAFAFYAIVAGLQAICIMWLWNGERKGYHGLLILGVINIGFSLLSGDIPQIVGSFVGLGILYMLVNPKSHLLTD